MIDHGITFSTIKPEHIRVDDYSVWVCTDIVEITRDNIMEDMQTTEYQFNTVQYTKDEYITLLSIQNEENNKLMNTILGV